MTHLSDYSYMARFQANLFAILFMMYRAWMEQGKGSLRNSFTLEALKSPLKHVRVFSCLLMFTSCFLFVVYDGIVMTVKYDEGFAVVFPADINQTAFDNQGLTASNYWIDTTPSSGGNVSLLYVPFDQLSCNQKKGGDYSPANQDLITASDSMLNCVWMFKTSSLFLLVSQFHYVITSGLSTTQKGSFSNEWESWIYTIYSIFGLFLYPILQWLFEYDAVLTAVIPQIMYLIELPVVGLLLFWTIFRWQKLTDYLASNKALYDKVLRYTYFSKVICFFLLLEWVGLGPINFDIISCLVNNLVDECAVYGIKFNQDFLVQLFSYGMTGIYITHWLMMFPNAPAAQTASAHHAGSQMATEMDSRVDSTASYAAQSTVESQAPKQNPI